MANPLLKTRQIADLQVTNGKLASDVGRANLLTNGGFEIWQRGNGPFTGNGVFGPDRWATGLQASDTMSVSRAASSIGTRSYSAQITFTLSGGTGNSGFYQAVVTSSETNLRGTTLTFSVLAKTSVANAVRAYGGFNGTGTATLYGAYHTGSGSAELLAVTFTIPVDCTSATCGVRFSASASVEVDNAMLVVGNVAADYAPLHPADDLARCLRYYFRINPPAASPVCILQAGTTTGAYGGVIHFPAKMAVPPVLTVSAPSTWGFWTANTTVQTLTSGPSSMGNNDSGNPSSAALTGQCASGLVAGNAVGMIGQGGSSFLAFEANP